MPSRIRTSDISRSAQGSKSRRDEDTKVASQVVPQPVHGQPGLRPTDIPGLQRTIGNRAVIQLLNSRRTAGQRQNEQEQHTDSATEEPVIHRLPEDHQAQTLSDVPRLPSARIFRANAKPKTGLMHPQRSNKKKLEKAVRNNDSAEVTKVSSLMFGAAPDYYLDLLHYKVVKHKGNQAKLSLYVQNAPLNRVFKAAWTRRDAVLVEASGFAPSTLPVAEQVSLAEEDPKFFFDHILLNLKKYPVSASAFREMIKIAGIRDALRVGVPTEWQALATTVPMLAVPEGIHEDVTAKKLTLTSEQIVDRIFDDLVNNRRIEVGYFTNNLDAANVILGGGTPEEKQARIDRAAADASMPSKPSTQCDNLMKVLQEVISMYPGLTPKFGITIEPQALLTVKLNTLSGGIIPNSFAGNVIDKDGNYTRQIFFTGVVGAKEPNSHTWNVVDGKAYDSVLGTKGAGVAASKAGSFKMIADGVWQDQADSTKELRTVPGDVKRASPNTMGFGTAYQKNRNW